MKKIVTLILLAIIAMIALFQITRLKHNKFLEAVCSYKSAGRSGSEAKVDKKYFYQCFTTEVFKKIFQGRKYCQGISKPNCAIQANDVLLCQGMLRQKRWTKSETDCQLNFACPELVADYDKIIADCSK